MDEPLAYAIDAQRRVAVLTYRAQPTISQWSHTIERILSDANCVPSLGVLLDRRMIFRPAETEYIKRMVRLLDERYAAGKVARCAIVTADPGSYGMGRMAEQLTTFEGSIRTFKEFPDAEQWVGRADNN
jgi:hypothetical protein